MLTYYTVSTCPTSKKSHLSPSCLSIFRKFVLRSAQKGIVILLKVFILSCLVVFTSCQTYGPPDRTTEQNRTRCPLEEAKNRARSLAFRGLPATDDDKAFLNCENESELRETFLSSYENDSAQFCSQAFAIKLAKESFMSQGESPNFSICENALAFQTIFAKSYQEARDRFCRPKQFSNLGQEDGRRGRREGLVEKRLTNCSDAARVSLVSSYDQGFRIGLRHFCSKKNIDRLALADSRANTNALLPVSLQHCQAVWPEVETFYSTRLKSHRENFTKMYCNHKSGKTQAETDAVNYDVPQLESMPDFCTPTQFEHYRSGYLSTWAGIKERYCSPTTSFEQGITDGQLGNEMQLSVPAHCSQALRSQMLQRYREGYYYSRKKADENQLGE